MFRRIWQKAFPKFDFVKTCKQNCLAQEYLTERQDLFEEVPNADYTRNFLEELRNGYSPDWKDMFEENALNKEYRRLYEKLRSNSSYDELLPFDQMMVPDEGWDEFLKGFPKL